MVTYKEKTRTYKFKCFVPDTLKNWIGRFGVILGLIVVLFVMIGLTGMFTRDFFNLEFFLRISIGVVVFAILIYSALYSTKTAVLTYDELILMKDHTGFLKKRIPYSEIKEAGFVPLEPELPSSEESFLSPEQRWRYTQEGDEKLTRGGVYIRTRKGKTYVFEVESPNMFVKLVRERKGKFKLQAKFSISRK